jgi:hypothetical protein
LTSQRFSLLLCVYLHLLSHLPGVLLQYPLQDPPTHPRR